MVFEKLQKISEIDIEFKARSALAIQAGKVPTLSPIDQPVIKREGKPLIPGSSIKGALRSMLEAILAQSGIKVCIPEATIPTKERDKARYAQDMGRLPPCEGKRDICPVCEIFGAAGLSGRAIFLDALVEGSYTLIERNHVAISRSEKAATSGTLMRLQAVESGAIFREKIRVINPEGWHIGALLNAIQNIECFGLGSKKTAGYGEIETNVVNICEKELKEGEWKSDSRTMEELIRKSNDEFKNFLTKRA